MKHALVRGVSAPTSEAWIGFLLNEGVKFSIEEKGTLVKVDREPIPILEKAKTIPGLMVEAERSIAERKIEQRISSLWPEVSDPAICLARSDEVDRGSLEDTSVFAVVRNFPINDREKLVEIVNEFAGPVDGNRVAILGGVASIQNIHDGDGKQSSVSIARR